MSCTGIIRASRKDGRQTDTKDFNNISYRIKHTVGVSPSKNETKTNCMEVRTASCDVPNSEVIFTPITHTFTSTSHSDLSSDIGSLINDDEMDLDAVMKNDGMDAGYLGDSIECIDSSNFLSSKDTVDMCLVTNICDIGLGLDLPTINSCDKTFVCINETDCNAATILNDYQEQDSLLHSLTNGDLLDKDGVLVADTEMVNSHVMNASLVNDRTTEETSTNSLASNAITTNNEHYILTNDPNILSKDSSKVVDENHWIDHLEMPSDTQSLTSAIDGNKDKQNWESLSLPSQRTSGDLDSEKDFPEFNFLALQTDPTDGIINSDLPQIDLLEGSEIIENDSTDLQLDELSTTVNYTLPSCSPVLTASIKCRKQWSSLSVESVAAIKSDSVALRPNSQSLLKRNLLSKSTNPSLLLRSQKHHSDVIGQTVETSTLSSTPTYIKPINKHTTKNAMAIIAISTDKSKQTTQIVINTSQGEQIFKGKTSEFMRAPYIQVKNMDKLLKIGPGSKTAYSSAKRRDVLQSKNRENNTDTSLTNMDISNVSNEDLTKSTNELIMLSTPLSDLDDFMEDDRNVDVPLMEALAEVGITEDNLNRATVSSGRKLWICPVSGCGSLFPRVGLLKVHILGHYGLRPYRCDYQGCKWSFYKYFKLKRHKETHQKKKDFDCPIEECGRSFTTIYNLKTHIKLHNRPAEMLCPVDECDARFQTKRKLEVHMKDHDSAYAPYKCTFKNCGKHYYSSNALNSHIRSHQHKEEELRCQFCEKLYDKPCRLRFHLRTHTGDKPFSCTFEGCGWAFTSSSKLKRHMYKHTNERKFTCGIKNCGKSFMRSEHLKEHTLTHIHARSFACPIEGCRLRFQAKSSLYVHLKKHRQQNNPEQEPKAVVLCPVETCGRTYSCKSSLRQHMIKFHTPAVMTADTSHLDYIALLTGDEDNLINLEGLQFTPETSPVANAAVNTSITTQLTPQSFSFTSKTDALANCASEYIDTNFIFQEEKRTSLLPSHTIKLEPSVSMTPEEMVVYHSDNEGSARTRCTFEDIIQYRARKNEASLDTIPLEQQIHINSISDIAMEAGLLSSQDIAHSFLLQDDLASNHFLYQDEHMLSVGAGVGEYQVLLLDSGPETHQEFAESTINLRDLE